MNWDNYQKKLKSSCSRLGVDEDNKKKLIEYAEILFNKNLPIIYDTKHLSYLVGFKEEFLFRVSNATEKFYHSFSIPKRNGKIREINEPYPTLKEIQRWILNNILYRIKISDYAKAYIKKRSIIDNARFHKNQPVVIKLDVKDFFGSITQNKIVYLYMCLGYTKNVSILLANLCCLDGVLPQGASTSPYLSNIYSISIDKVIGKYTKDRGLRYTRYSDDITISGSLDKNEIGKTVAFVKNVLENSGLTLQEEKTRILRNSTCQAITGIIVNKKMSVARKRKKDIRQEMYYIKKFGIDAHMSKRNITKANYINHLRGLINFVLFIEKSNKEFLFYRDFLKEKNEV